jgi:integrase
VDKHKIRTTRGEPYSQTITAFGGTLHQVVWYEGKGRKRKAFGSRVQAEEFLKLRKRDYHSNARGNGCVTLTGADYSAYLQITAGGRTLLDAANSLNATATTPSLRECTVKQLVDEFYVAQRDDGCGKRHLGDLKSRLGNFAEHFGDDTIVSTIQPYQIDEWLRSLPIGPQTRNHYRAAALNAMNFAVRQKYIAENPVKGAKKLKADPTDTRVLSVSQAEALLRNCGDEIRGYAAIGLFAGLRREEIMKLDWSNVDLGSGQIYISGRIAKTRSNRHVPIHENLKAWLEPLKKDSGPVAPQSRFEGLWDRARQAAGVLTDWPPNACRHSYGSYRYALTKNETLVSAELGHDPRTFFQHYRKSMAPSEAEKYFRILPPE